MNAFFRILFIFASLTLFSEAASQQTNLTSVEQQPAGAAVSGTLKRKLTIRAHEVFEQRKLRVYAIADESDSEGRFLLNTLDSRAFKLFGNDPKEAPLDAASLSTVATKSPAIPRETAILFESSQSMPQQKSDAVRKAVVAFLNGFRSDVLTVRMGNDEKNIRLAWISPSQSENPRALQRAILDSPAVAGAQGITSPVCSGIRDLNVLGDQNPAVLVQRNIIIVSEEHSLSSKGSAELRKCLGEAVDYGARIFWVELKQSAGDEAAKTDLVRPHLSESGNSKIISAAVEKSNGIRIKIAENADPTPAFVNFRSYMDDEYILEFDLTRFRPYSDVIELELVASYHGHVLKSGFFKAEGFVAQPSPEDLERTAQLQEIRRRREMMNLLMIFLLVSGTGILMWYWLRKKAHVCQDCSFVVERNFSDCPFRNNKCYGRLSIIHGPMTGKVFPLFSGDNSLGRSRSNTIRLKGSGIQRMHAKIVLSKRKALLTPLKTCGVRVNGVLTTDPRLLGSGSIIRVGDAVCRLDFKEGE